MRDRSKVNAGNLVDSIDYTLTDIKQKLAMFREQDSRLRKRMSSLSSSIEDLTLSRSSSPTPSEAEVPDVIIPSDDTNEEQRYKDDQTIENEIKKNPQPFSCDILNRLPSIAVTCYKTMYASDPSFHETAV